MALKALQFKQLKTLRFTNFYKRQQGLPILLPFIAYIALGVGNIICLQQAIQNIPNVIVFAVWTGVTLVVIKLIDVFYYRHAANKREFFFIGLIVAGIIGMKIYSSIQL